MGDRVNKLVGIMPRGQTCPANFDHEILVWLAHGSSLVHCPSLVHHIVHRTPAACCDASLRRFHFVRIAATPPGVAKGASDHSWTQLVVVSLVSLTQGALTVGYNSSRLPHGLPVSRSCGHQKSRNRNRNRNRII